ncbi:MAG: iron-containing redox enzyme family protein, partial [Hyphomonadaceae bacterium]
MHGQTARAPDAFDVGQSPEQRARKRQALLAHWNRRRLAMQTPIGDWRERLEDDYAMCVSESAFIEAARLGQARRAAAAPRSPTAFVAWFEALKENGPGQNDPLFPWLAAKAGLEDMRWFIEQEVA